MIELYGGASPNALKILIMLEELELAYKVHNVNVMQGEQYTPEFLALNPLGKYPVVIDHDGAAAGQPIFESGAILIYLAETYNSGLLPISGPERWDVLKWLMVQVSWVGPMLGQNSHFRIQPSEVETYAARRYSALAIRIWEVLDAQLRKQEWLAGDMFSIADLATFPWVKPQENATNDPNDYPALEAWRKRIVMRPATMRAMAVAADFKKAFLKNGPRDEADLDRLFLRQGGPAVDFGRLSR